MLSCGVHLAVLCHFRVFCRNKHFQKFFTIGSHNILVFPCQTLWQYSDGNPLIGALNAGMVGKNHDSWQTSGYRVECDQQLTVDHAIVFGSYHGHPFTAQTSTHQWILFITASMDDTPHGREQNKLVVHSSKSEAEITSNRRSTYCTIEANYWQTRTVMRPLQ